MVSQITVVSIVYSTISSGADQRKYQSFASLASVGGIHRWRLPFDDVILENRRCNRANSAVTNDLCRPPKYFQSSNLCVSYSYYTGCDIRHLDPSALGAAVMCSQDFLTYISWQQRSLEYHMVYKNHYIIPANYYNLIYIPVDCVWTLGVLLD